MDKVSLIEYLGRVINLNMKDNLNYMEVSESLDTISQSKYLEFKKFLTEQAGSEKYSYSTSFQKFIGIFSDFKKNQLLLSDEEHCQVSIFCDKLYYKVTWYFDELKWLNPTKEQLEKQIWKNHQYEDKSLISEKEEQVVDKIGDTFEIYRLVTQNKPQLKEKIEKIVRELVSNKKKKTLGIENKQQKRLFI